MTVDIRAKVICRIGEEEPEIISGGWSDDHAQGTGLIRTRGELVVRGLYRFTLGQPVEIAYIQNDTASRVPRSLRVLSAFADPFRRQTTLQLGCAITLRENLRGSEPSDRTADTWDDPENSTIVCTAFTEGTISISAAYIATKCATKLGINHTGFGFLNSWFAVEQFDLSPGYATVLGDLLVSESWIGFLDASDTLQVRSLLDFAGTYTVIDQGQIIDVSPINSGDIPGDAVSVRYSYSRFKKPEDDLTEEEQQIRDWEKDETVGPPENREIAFEGGTYSRTVTPVSTMITSYDSFDRVIKRVETLKTHVCVTNPDYIKWYSQTGEAGIQDVDDYKITETTIEYLYKAAQLVEEPEPPPPGSCSTAFANPQIFDPDRDTIPVRQTTIVKEPDMAIAGALNIGQYSDPEAEFPWAYHPSLTVNNITKVETIEYEQDPLSGITKTTTTTQLAQAFTQAGQQVGAAEAQDAIKNATPLVYVVTRGRALVNAGSKVETRTDRRFGLQKRPNRTERNNNATRKSAVETVTRSTFIQGSSSSENVTEYSLPYTPDDRISYVGGQYIVTPSNAELVARNYGRAQNRLAHGHRNGFSLQLPAPVMPPYPLDRISVSGSGYAAGYICNGTSWSFDSNGIVCNTDALFVGGIGETEVGGSLWFPVQPGITLLGPAPVVYENEYPEPANSIPIDESFDPLNPPPTFWDDDLPTDTPAIPTEETEIEELVPPWLERQDFVFAARSTINVVRTDPSVPTLQPVTLVVRSAISARAIPVRYASFPVFTEMSVERLPVAVREAPVEIFTMYSFGLGVF